jgi:glycosyltransferase involved in cell wall biosynthesis
MTEMKILYVTPLWTGLRDLLYSGSGTSSGMPAFIRPLQRLISSEHQVDIALLVDDALAGNSMSPPDWLTSSNIRIVPRGNSSTSRLRSYRRLLFLVNQMISENGYDFIYGHGLPGVVGTYAAKKSGLASGHRLYGTFLSKHLGKWPALRTFLYSPLEYFAFTWPKSFLLMTNDGTRGDIVHEAIGKRGAYDFHFWLNGVDHLSSHYERTQRPEHTTPGLYLLYPARISRWKQQHLAVELLARLQRKVTQDVVLRFVGHASDPEYLREVESLALETCRPGSVEFLGPVPTGSLQALYSGAVAVLSMYNLSNLGNVAIEAISSGAVLLALNDGSLDGIINHGDNGLLMQDLNEGADLISKLIANPKWSEAISGRAIQSARHLFSSWEARSDREISLIRSAVSNHAKRGTK